MGNLMENLKDSLTTSPTTSLTANLRSSPWTTVNGTPPPTVRPALPGEGGGGLRLPQGRWTTSETRPWAGTIASLAGRDAAEEVHQTVVSRGLGKTEREPLPLSPKVDFRAA